MDDSILEGAKVLIVDDVNDNIKLLGRMLRSYKCKISVAINGKQAVDVSQEIIPDIILMDVNMPEMNGFDATEIIKQRESTAHIPIIFLTALSDVEEVIEGFEKGGLDYITKPFNTKILLSRLKTHLSVKFASEKIRESDAQKTKFLSIVSHDLRSPMSGLVGLIKMINSDFESFDKAELTESLVSLEEALVNQYNFLETMLKWGNLQFNKVALDKATIDINFLVNQILSVLELNAKNKNIELITEIDINQVYGDYNLIYGIYHNLTVNAIKYTKEDGKVILKAKDAGDHYLCSVKDSGIGMPKAVAESLFRVDKVQSRPGTNNESGTGLGLIVSYESVIKHDGRIWVETEENEGSEFFFTLNKER